jgi:hypothetical protein
MDTEKEGFYGYEIVVYGLLLFVELVRVGRLREMVLLKESAAGHVSCYSGR